jgi:hypothetical protein
MPSALQQLSLILILSGCLTQTVVKEKFICADGWVADQQGECIGRAPKTRCPRCENDTVYVFVLNASKADVVIKAKDECVSLGCPPGSRYAASKNSRKFHTCGCHFAKRIAKKNLVCYSGEGPAMVDKKRYSGC